MSRTYRQKRGGAVRVLTILALLTTSAQAYERDADGCEQLAAAVRTQVEGAISSRQFGGRKTRARLQVMPATNLSCGTTAAVASAAFSESFARYGMNVEWNNGMPPDPGDYCLSHRLDQCYPGTHGGLLTALPQRVVDNSWQAVSLALSRQMPFGVGSDIIYFSPVVLRETLAVSLQAASAWALEATTGCSATSRTCAPY